MAYWLGDNIREADKKEIRAMATFEAPVPFLVQCELEGAAESTASILDEFGNLRGFFGHSEWPETWENPPSGGCVWLFSDDYLFESYPKTIFRCARDLFLPHCLSKYGTVGNYVHESNHTHLRWLDRLGFRPAFQAKEKGETFYFMLR